MTQAQFAAAIGMNHPNNVSARLENPHYGKHTLTTLKKIAAACDVALVVWFVPFSRFVDWSTGTPYLDFGLRPSFFNIPPFDKDVLSATSSDVGIQVVLNGAGKSDITSELPNDEQMGELPLQLITKVAPGSVKMKLPPSQQENRYA